MSVVEVSGEAYCGLRVTRLISPSEVRPGMVVRTDGGRLAVTEVRFSVDQVEVWGTYDAEVAVARAEFPDERRVVQVAPDSTLRHVRLLIAGALRAAGPPSAKPGREQEAARVRVDSCTEGGGLSLVVDGWEVRI